MDAELRQYLNGIFVLLTVILGTLWAQATAEINVLTGVLGAVAVGGITYAVFVSPAYTVQGALDNLSDLTDLITRR